MSIYSVKANDLEIRLEAYSENAVRVRVGSEFKETLFEKYGIYRKGEECGEVLENGVKTGKLSVVYSDGKIVFSSDKFTRTMQVGDNVDDVREYMNDRLGKFRPEYIQIIGDEAKRHYGTVDFELAPKYIKIDTEGEKFYGLGESNTDRLILNGKTYLERVVYQRWEIPVPFVMTKSGYGVLCNSTFWHGVDVCARNEKEILWYLPDGELDFFIFAGDTLPEVLDRFTYITGRPMLLPKWAYGLTFIEQYFADQFEVMHTAEKFRALGMPCDTISLEPGWMKKTYDFSPNKMWNREKFFINEWARHDNPHDANDSFFSSALHRYGFKLQLWLCSDHDFSANEERLAGNEVNPDIPAWFDHLRPFVNDGANSFKVDPCHVCDSADEARVYANGRTEPEMHNLMQTLCVKEMYQGAKGYTGIRPMHHFCGGYTGAGAYSAATTGDSGGRLPTLAWTLNLGMSGFSNITCDMVVFEKETLHYGFFTAWCQLNSWAGFCHPWWAGDELEATFTFYDKLRYHLMPYIYSAAITANLNGMPVVRAMPLYCDDEECENSINQYMFGDNFLVGAFSNQVWLPRGTTWTDMWTGKVYEGGQYASPEIPSDRGGLLFVRGGAIIPTEEPKMFCDGKDSKKITLEVYPEGSSSGVLYEDDGITLGYEEGKRSKTEFFCDACDSGVVIKIGAREGEFDGIYADREYAVKLVCGEKMPKSVVVDGCEVAFTKNGACVEFEMGKATKAEINY